MRGYSASISPWKLTLIREFWKKNPKRGSITERVFQKKIQSVAWHDEKNDLVYVPVLWIFFRKSRSVTIPKKWYIFLFSMAYFPSYWHMSFHIRIIIELNWHSICKCIFFQSNNWDVTSDESGFLSLKTRSVMVPKIHG